jgi:F-type H+-transporting ATPase subunit delta
VSNVVSRELLAPYATALLDIAKSQNSIDWISSDVDSILALLSESPDLKQLITSPLVSVDAQKSVMGRILGDQANPVFKNFIMVLIDRRRIVLLEGICKEFQAKLRELNQAVLAEVTSAAPLSDAQRQSIFEKVTAMTGARHVDLEAKVDPTLIGGVIIKVGSQVIDASLQGQLRQIGLRLAKG